MDDIIYNSLISYFKTLSVYGYKSYDDVYKILYLICVRDFVYNDYKGYITQDDYREIERSLYGVFGTTCLIPYPEFCKNKSMNKLSLGSVTELTNRVQHNEEKLNQLKDSVTSDIIGLSDTINEFMSDATTKINNYKTEIDASEADYKNQIQSAVDSYKEATDAVIKQYQDNISATIADYKSTTDTKINNYYTTMSSKIEDYKTQTDKSISTLKNTKVIKGNSNSVVVKDIVIK